METFKQFVEQMNNVKNIKPSSVTQRGGKLFVRADDIKVKLKRGDLVKVPFKGHMITSEVSNFRNGVFELQRLSVEKIK